MKGIPFAKYSPSVIQVHHRVTLCFLWEHTSMDAATSATSCLCRKIYFYCVMDKLFSQRSIFSLEKYPLIAKNVERLFMKLYEWLFSLYDETYLFHNTYILYILFIRKNIYLFPKKYYFSMYYTLIQETISFSNRWNLFVSIIVL